jgi:hypothetical protein
VGLQLIWGGFFFVWRYLLQIKVSRLRKNFNILKKQFFDEVFSILVLLLEVSEIFQIKNDTHPDWVLLPTLKISAQTDEICGFTGGKL